MIPADIVEFVHGPQIALIGTRGASLRPTSARTVGLIAGPASDTISIVVPEATGARTFENLTNNGRIALIVSEFPSHRTYQFKGTCLDIGPCSADQNAVRNLYLEKLDARMREYLWVKPPAGYIERLLVDPSRVIRLRIETIFDQTPGPNAGQPLPFKPSGGP
ncbi:MAG: pyridoxamine 5'-phosphate oxidase family protein [Alphaproteobacteria bacterium]|nr:pyridoxamine 5'-phosphate oxidase family protein [Alphaproteobacteria bacterium]